MDPKERKELVNDMAQGFKEALRQDRNKNGYVASAACKKTHEELNEGISQINKGIDRQHRTTTKLAQIVDKHLTESDIKLTVGEKAERDKERAEEKRAKEKSDKLKKYVAWFKIGSIILALLGSLLGGAYALGQMEERITAKLEKNGD